MEPVTITISNLSSLKTKQLCLSHVSLSNVINIILNFSCVTGHNSKSKAHVTHIGTF
jgi:hypothetical protein